MPATAKKVIIFLFVLMLSLVACGRTTPVVMPSQTPGIDILPYHTSTYVISSPTPGNDTPMPRTPDPTATPFAHTIAKGDTMLGIAIRYGIEMDDLQAANPGVDPNMLSVGTQLIIPLGGDLESSIATPTPLPITLEDPDCYPTNDGGAWCFVLVENLYPHAIENLAARVVLSTQQGDNPVEDIAFPPLNRIGPGDRLPLMVFFPAPVPALFSAKAELLTAVEIPDSSDRYLNAEVEISAINVQASSRMATVTGQVSFPESMVYPGLLWLSAVAYGEQGDVVGVRKWEAVFPGVNPQPDASGTPDAEPTDRQVTLLPIPFELDVFSLGPAVDHVEVLIEARP